MATIASLTFSVRDQQVKFEFKLVPSDMKWLAKFSGELSNAARYLCSFANVQLSELQERGKSLSNNPQSKWRPWEYKFRVEVAKKVAHFKEKQGRPINAAQEQTLRSKVCNHIASLKSRQEFLVQLFKMQSVIIFMWEIIVGGIGISCFSPMFWLKERFPLV